jgi:MFS family permease
MPYTVLMPAIASTVLGGGPNALGALMAATGLGAVAGAFYMASRQSVLGLGHITGGAAFVFGGALVAFGLSREFWLSLAILPLVGAAFILTMASTNTYIQTVVEERLRGRVMAFYTMAFLGTAPIGSLIAGVLANRIGAPNTIVLGGAACMAGALWYFAKLPALRPRVRREYVERGVLPGPDTRA